MPRLQSCADATEAVPADAQTMGLSALLPLRATHYNLGQAPVSSEATGMASAPECSLRDLPNVP
jgi:hypothetical protein